MNKLQNHIVLHKEYFHRIPENLINLFRDIVFTDATGCIISYYPKDWKTVHRPPTDQEIFDHLTGKKWIGPRYQKRTCLVYLDHDKSSLDEIYDYHSMINATTANSRLYTSVSPGHYHTVLRVAPTYSPISSDLVQSSFEPYTSAKLFEVYPNRKLGIRAPFGKYQEPVYECCQHLDSVEDKLDDLLNIDIFPLDALSYDLQNLDLFPDLPKPQPRGKITPVGIDLSPRAKLPRDTFRYSEEEARDLNVKGLTEQGTRDHAQTILFIDQYSLKVPLGDATRVVMKFMRDHHNDFSNDYNRNQRYVFDHIFGQGKRIYDHLRKFRILPEDIHCADREFITEASFSIVLDNSNADWPLAKGLTENVVYCSSRQHREVLRVRWDRLRKWYGASYLKRIEELKTSGAIIERGSIYRHHKDSKYLMLDMPKMNPADAILFNGRPAKTAEEALIATRTRAESRQLLIDKGFPRENAKKIVQRIYARNGDKTDAPVRSCGQVIRGEVKSPLSIPF